MGGADVAGRYTLPFDIETETGKVSEDEGESASNSEGRDVFKEHEVGSYVANNSRDVRPEPAIIVNPAAGAGRAPRLAGEASRDEIHATTPASAVEAE